MKNRVAIILIGHSQPEALRRALIEAGFHESDTARADLLVTGWGRGHAGEGIELLNRARRTAPGIPVVVVAEESSEQLAIEAFRAGAADYVPGSWPNAAFAAAVSRLTRQAPAQTEFIGGSAAVRDIREAIRKLGPSDSNVLITGETGTGKELVARSLHRHSRRPGGAFQCINCAAIPDTLLESELFGFERGAFTGAHARFEGKLQSAHRGTVFFDEIGDMSLYAQAKILRVLDKPEIQMLGSVRTQSLDLRFIAATNQYLPGHIGAGRFRSDLYYRLNVGRIHIPPLRERKEDVLLLAGYYAREIGAGLGHPIEAIAEDAMEALTLYDWPGNVRELRNAIEAAIVNCAGSRITAADLPRELIRKGVPPCERDLLLSALNATNWNKTETARKLNWSRMTVYRKLSRYGVHNAAPGSAGTRGCAPLGDASNRAPLDYG